MGGVQTCGLGDVHGIVRQHVVKGGPIVREVLINGDRGARRHARGQVKVVKIEPRHIVVLRARCLVAALPLHVNAHA